PGKPGPVAVRLPRSTTRPFFRYPSVLRLGGCFAARLFLASPLAQAVAGVLMGGAFHAGCPSPVQRWFAVARCVSGGDNARLSVEHESGAGIVGCPVRRA